MVTAASETLRLSGIDEDINTSRRYDAIKPCALAMDRASHKDEIGKLLASQTCSWAASPQSPKPAHLWSPRQRKPATRLRWRRRP